MRPVGPLLRRPTRLAKHPRAGKPPAIDAPCGAGGSPRRLRPRGDEHKRRSTSLDCAPRSDPSTPQHSTRAYARGSRRREKRSFIDHSNTNRYHSHLVTQAAQQTRGCLSAKAFHRARSAKSAVALATTGSGRRHRDESVRRSAPSCMVRGRRCPSPPSAARRPRRTTKTRGIRP